MIESYPVTEKQRAMLGTQRIDHNPTVEENIDERIRYYESELLRLKQITGVAALFQNRDFSQSWEAEIE